MTQPQPKRVRIGSTQELHSWLSGAAADLSRAMLVTHTASNPQKHVSHQDVAALLAEFGWHSHRRYTLGKTLIGHVIERQSG